MLRPVASVKASKNAKADHELSLTDMLQARTSYLKHIKEAGWPEKHIAALFKFFWNLECHPFRLSTRHGDRILATYAAKIRRHWHDRLKSGLAFNIAIINDNLLQHVVTEVNDAVLGKVSISFLFQPHARIFTTSLFPSFPHASQFGYPNDVLTGASYHVSHLKVESFMILQASPTSSQRRARRLYATRADYSRDRRRSSRSKSPPPLRFRSSNGAHRESPHPSTDAKPSQNRTARDGAHNKSACPSCLGRHPHDINNCSVELLWDGTPAYARRTPEGRLVDPVRDILCHDWQKPQGCSRPHNNAKHACSGCGSTYHGAQKCPKAQPRSHAI